ncbi:MAG TPA: hypothetical protein VI603_05160 [Saprospiraceae bacterium]|nr:hypothetical protein [Saprospiraceae bacterium]
MNKVVPLTFYLCVLISVSHVLNAQEKIGIGTSSPAFLLDVQGYPSSTLLTNLNSKVNYVGALDIKAIEGTSVTSAGYGIGGKFTGGSRGLDILGMGGSSTGAVYGTYSNATGTAGAHYGVYGLATGGVFNFGVYGYANGGIGNYGIFGYNTNLAGYAGYFTGRGHFTEELRADKNLLVDDNLGIGTLTPTTRLQVVGGNDASYTTHGFIQTGTTASWNIVIDDNEILGRNNGAENELFIQRDGGDLILCALELGSVGIGLLAGTSIPTGYMLAVDGKIVSEELRIQNSDNWPDYVFSDHYPLMPLEDLKRSIAEHKHLPNIPSATVVASEGILIGDMQKKMMEKIEELTLYVIDLHEMIRKQQEEIEQQKAEIRLLSGK